jgi:hypothetical protein
MSIHETTNVLLMNTDRTATWLNLADKYIQSYNENPSHFVLPKAYRFLLPLIESYANNLEGFLQYLIGIRDSLPRSSGAYKDVQALYRRVNGRYTQQVRRERSNRAIAKAEEKYGAIDFHTRQKWVADLEHEWAQRRLGFLDKASRGKRLSIEERAELLAEFWDGIDTEISKGKGLPKWN